DARGADLLGDGDEEGAGVFAPAAIRIAVIRDQRARHLVDVVVAGDLSQQIPFHRVALEGIEDLVAAPGIVESPEVSAVGVGDDRTVASFERGAQDFADGGALARAGRADDLEVLGLIVLADREAGERERAVAALAPSVGPGYTSRR